MICASIDLGTNTARLLIAENKDGKLRTLHVEREIVRLGGGFTDDCGLSVEAWQRGLNCMKKFASAMQRYHVEFLMASATSAVRDAVNGSAFVDRVKSDTGIQLVVIDGENEGRLTLDGVMSGLDMLHDSMLVLDIGGGSTEITIASHGVPSYINSLPLGVVRLTEGFSTCESMRNRISSVLDHAAELMSTAGIQLPHCSEMISTAGTATTLAAIQMEMQEYDSGLVNNFIISRHEIEIIFERLLRLSPSERLLVPGLEKGREDLIIAGILITTQFMDKFGFTRMKVSDYGLLEGLALAAAKTNPLLT